MAVITKNGHVDNAVRLYNKARTMYVGLGNGKTEWSNASVPGTEDETLTELPELVGMRLATKVSLARPLPEGSEATSTITYAGTVYELVAVGDAYQKDAEYLYVSAVINPSDLPAGSYRSIGLFTDPTFQDGVTGDAVDAGKIISQGTLHMYENRVSFDRTNASVNEQFMIHA